jgi:hypothetical protein
MHEWAKKLIFRKNRFFHFSQKTTKNDLFLAKNSKNRPKILARVKILHYNLHSIERYSKNEFFQVAH